MTRTGNDLSLRIGGYNRAKTLTLTNTTNTTPVNIPNFTFPVVSGRSYNWSAIVRVQTSNATTGILFSYTAPANIEGSWNVICPETATYVPSFGTYQQGQTLGTSGLPVANTSYYAYINGWFDALESGTFQLKFQTETQNISVGVFQFSRLTWIEQ